MRVPTNAGGGLAKITLSMPDWKEENVAPWTMKALLIGDEVDMPHVARVLKETNDPGLRQDLKQAIGLFSPDGEGAAELLNSTKAQ